MCGFFFSAGINVQRRVIDTIAHRGPDAEFWSQEPTETGPVSLGFQRLSIFDPSSRANQPFRSCDGRQVLLFNGAIYNFLELRDTLVAKGHAFTTTSDTEVLLAAWLEWGEAALEKLSGMFAFVIWDRPSGDIIAVRDRYGIKPLYFSTQHGGLAIASEIKQLLQIQGQSRWLNLDCAFDFLLSGVTDHRRLTFFEGVEQLRGGEVLHANIRQPGQRPKVRRWTAPANGEQSVSAEVAAKTFGELLEASVDRHLRSDVTVGSALSGGLDSSSIVSIADSFRHARGDLSPFMTITAGFAGTAIDETRFAQSVTNAGQTLEGMVIEPSPEQFLSDIDRLIWHQDMPFGSSSIFAQWCVFEAARRANVKVMLDGQGADEILAGYHGAFQQRYLGQLRALNPVGAIVLARQRARLHGTSAMNDLRQACRTYLSQSFLGPVIGRVRRRRGILPESFAWLDGLAFGDWLRSPRRDVAGQCAQRDGMKPPVDIPSLCQLMTHSISLPMLLRFEDRNSMAHGIEARVPFLDPALAEFCLTLPARHKISKGWTKSVLRRAMRGRLPDEVLWRWDKIGFETPQANWMKGALSNWMAESTRHALDRFPSLFSNEGVNALLDLATTKDHGPDERMWRIAILGAWARVFDVEAV